MEGNLEVCCTGSGNCNGRTRNFLTREEKIEMLKEYKEAIDKEAQGVKERIAELENEQ